jgi:hypothetical protein
MLLKLWTNSYVSLRVRLRVNQVQLASEMKLMWQLSIKSRWTDLIRPCNTIKYIKNIRNAIKTMNKFIRQSHTQSYSCAACEWNEVDYLTHLGCDLQYNTIYQKYKKCLYNYEQIHTSVIQVQLATVASEMKLTHFRMWQFQWKNARQTK